MRLVGIAEPPALAGTHNIEASAKKPETVHLPVTNWLDTTATFDVQVSADPDAAAATVASFHATRDTVIIPGGQTRTVAISFLAHKEGTAKATVRLGLRGSEEYVEHVVNVAVGTAAVLSEVFLQGVVRQLRTSAVPVDNPTDEAVHFSVASSLAEVAVPASFEVGPRSSALLPISWRPLVAGRRQASISVEAPTLGRGVHDLSVDALSPADPASLSLRSPLGGSQTLPFRFVSFLRGLTSAGGAGAVAKYAVKVVPEGGPFGVALREVAVDLATDDAGVEVYGGGLGARAWNTYPLTSLAPVFSPCLPPWRRGRCSAGGCRRDVRAHQGGRRECHFDAQPS